MQERRAALGRRLPPWPTARRGTPRTAPRQGQLLPRARRRGREHRDGLLQVGIRQTIVIVFIYLFKKSAKSLCRKFFNHNRNTCRN